MTKQRAGWILLGVQLALVLSIAGKFAYERATRPRIWVRAGVYDPSTPLRGKYIGLTLEVDACSLPQTGLYAAEKGFDGHPGDGLGWNWEVRRVVAENGHLVAHDAAGDAVLHGDDSYRVSLAKGAPCTSASLQPAVSFFIAEHDNGPFPLKAGTALWTEVTVPAKGEPRPIRYEVRNGEAFAPKWVNYTPYVGR